jgi:mannose-1-phosphate guanylyltransferase
MSHVPVDKCRNSVIADLEFLTGAGKVTDSLRERALERFENRSAADDWLRAEPDEVCSETMPTAEKSVAEDRTAANSPVGRSKRWGVILAGGEGTRLQRLTRLISGDDCPKQFCPLVGESTLLEQTRVRAERSIGREQVLIPLTRSHAKFYLGERGIRPSQRIVQSANKGTAPPMVYSLLSIEQNDSDAVVAILPCDHHYSDEGAFTAALESAFDIASANTGSVVLLGAPPLGPETEYGWIELGPPMGGDTNPALFAVRGFCEKPSLHLARQLFERQSLWNTFVMVGHVRAFLEMVRAAHPGLLEEFAGHRLWHRAEAHIPGSLYNSLQPVDFSREVLSVQPGRLIALRLDFVRWNDLGHPERVMDVLQAVGLKPWWMDRWQTPTHTPALAHPVTKAAVA